MKLSVVNIKDGEFTFGQKIDIMKLISSDVCEVDKIKGVITILGGKIKRITRWNAKKVLAYMNEVNNGLLYWAEREKNLLSYTLTAEEKKQGYQEISKLFGDFSTIDALAKRLNMKHEEVTNLQWGFVFAILWKDLEEHKIRMRNYEREKLSKK